MRDRKSGHPRFVVKVRGQSVPGSGILVSPDRVLTCAHVAARNGYGWEETELLRPLEDLRVLVPGADGVVPASESGQIRPDHVFPVRDGTVFAERYLTHAGVRLDLALLPLERPVPADLAEPAAFIQGATPEVLNPWIENAETRVVAWGFEGTSLVMGQAHDLSGELQPRYEQERLCRFACRLNIAGGNSGGALCVTVAGRLLCLGVAALGGIRSPDAVALGSDAALCFLGHEANPLRVKAQTVDLEALLNASGACEPRRAYLDEVARDEDRLPHMLVVRQLPHEAKQRLYIDVGLSQAGDERPFNLEELLALGPRWLLVGEPGSGKTTLLRHAAWDLARREAKGGGAASWTPLYLPLHRLAAGFRSAPGKDALEKLLAFLWAKRSYSQARLARLRQEREAGRLLVLLDGLDEVSARDTDESLRQDLLDWIGQLDQTLGRGFTAAGPDRPAIVVATRPTGDALLSDPFREARLVRLDEPRQQSFLEGYFQEKPPRSSTRSPAEWVAWFQEHPGFSYLAGNPLWLTLAAFVIEQGRTPSLARHEFYDDLVECMLRQQWKETSARLPHLKLARRVLRALALHMTTEGARSLPYAEIEDYLTHRLAGAGESVKRPARGRSLLDDFRVAWPGAMGAADFLRSVSKAGVLWPLDRSVHEDALKDDLWGFLHACLQEALAAEALRELHASGRAGRKRVLDLVAGASAGRRRFFVEPLSLLAEQIEEPDHQRELFDRLLQIDRSIALRTLASTPRAPLDLIGEVLNGERAKDREAVAAVFKRLFDLVAPDPSDEQGREVVARFLGKPETIRPSGRLDSERLFWVDEALGIEEERAREHSALRAACQAARVRLYRSIEPPDVDALRWIEIGGRRVATCVDVPAGTFWMGSPDDDRDADDNEYPQHPVSMSGFRLWRTPITLRQYHLFDPEHRDYWSKQAGFPEDEQADRPVTEVSWWSAMAFSRWLGFWLSHGTSLEGTLPTEAQWEYACRGESVERAEKQTRFATGNGERSLDDCGWYGKNSGRRVHAIGRKRENGFELFDMHGNVWEWCRDDRRTYVSSDVPIANPVGQPTGVGRAVRGGCFWFGARGCRSAYRDWVRVRNRSRYLGFRPVLPAAAEGR